MEVGFVRGQSDNLPAVDLYMVVNYFSNNEKYISAEIRGLKLVRSGRETYGDNAVGYVQVRRQGTKCTVKARITPEHRVRSTNYRCTFICDEQEKKIENVECDDCAASKGGCKHAVALVMWLHRRSEEPACTDVTCYWKKPKLSTVGSNIKYIKATEMGTAQKRPPKPATHSGSNGNFLQSVIQKSLDQNIKSQLMTYFEPTEDLYKISLHYLVNLFKVENINSDVESFIAFCKEKMTVKQCEAIEKATSSQADSRLWYELRYGRITASKAYESAHCHTSDGVLVDYLLGAYKLKETFAIKRGKYLEAAVFEEVSKRKKIKFRKNGLILSPEFPLLGASPDGISDECVLEIKCPISNTNIKKYIQDKKITNKYYAQMQLQMFFSNKEKCLFCIAHEDFETTKKLDIHDVIFNKIYCDELIEECMKFWKKNIFEKI